MDGLSLAEIIPFVHDGIWALGLRNAYGSTWGLEGMYIIE